MFNCVGLSLWNFHWRVRNERLIDWNFIHILDFHASILQVTFNARWKKIVFCYIILNNKKVQSFHQCFIWDLRYRYTSLHNLYFLTEWMSLKCRKVTTSSILTIFRWKWQCVHLKLHTNLKKSLLVNRI